MNDLTKLSDAELDGDLQMELVEMAFGNAGKPAADQIVAIIREIAKREATQAVRCFVEGK